MFKVDVSDFKRMNKDLNKLLDEYPRAVSRSVNRALKGSKTVAVRAIAKETGLKSRNVREKLREYTARPKAFSAYLDAAEGTAYNLISSVNADKRNPQTFRERKKNGAFRFKGVKAKAWGKTKEYKGTFIIRSTKGPLVVSRDGNGGLKPIQGPSVRQEFKRDNIQMIMRQRVSQQLPKELNHEIRREISRLSKR